MSQSKKSIYIALTGVIYIIMNGFLGMIVIKLIIEKYGSDFNGLNATATQFLNMLLLIEGGFTVATSVALLKPYKYNDTLIINKILSSTKEKFLKIGFLFIGIGIITSFIYSLFIKSNFGFWFIFTLFIMTIFPAAVNLCLAIKYKVIIQMEQKEYLINILNILTITITHVINIFITINVLNVNLIRLNTMVLALLNSLIIIIYAKKRYKHFNFTMTPDYNLIKGTSDIFLQKLIAALYATLPMLFITSSIGTVLGSVYIVYNNVFLLIKGILMVVLNSPKMALGYILSREEKKENFYIFKQYQFISTNIICIFMIPTAVMIMPFVKLYTKKMDDVDYIDEKIALLMVFITIVEVIHIPSGILLNMTGQFKITRNIQIIGGIILIISLIFGYKLLGIYGILSGVLITALILGILEVYIVYNKYFENKLKDFVVMIISIFGISLLLYIVEKKFFFNIENWYIFILKASIIFFINIIALGIWNLVFFKKLSLDIIEKIKKSVGNNKNL